MMNLILTLSFVSFIWTVGVLIFGIGIITIDSVMEKPDNLGEEIAWMVGLVLTGGIMYVVPNKLLKTYRNKDLLSRRNQFLLHSGNVEVRLYKEGKNGKPDEYEIRITKSNEHSIEAEGDYVALSEEEAELAKFDIIENQAILNKIYRTMNNHTVKIDEKSESGN